MAEPGWGGVQEPLNTPSASPRPEQSASHSHSFAMFALKRHRISSFARGPPSLVLQRWKERRSFPASHLHKCAEIIYSVTSRANFLCAQKGSSCISVNENIHILQTRCALLIRPSLKSRARAPIRNPGCRSVHLHEGFAPPSSVSPVCGRNRAGWEVRTGSSQLKMKEHRDQSGAAFSQSNLLCVHGQTGFCPTIISVFH